MKETIEKTVNTSLLTEEQFQSLLRGEMTFEQAYKLAPGPDWRIVEFDIEDISNEEKGTSKT